MWTLHYLKGRYNALGKLDLLSDGEIVVEFQVDLGVGTGDTPAHSSEDLVKRFDIKSGPEVTVSDEVVADGLEKFGLLILII